MARPKAAAVVSERFRALIELRGQQDGYARGWQSRVAAELGIDPSELSKARRGRRNIGWDLAMKVAGRTGINPSFFAGDSAVTTTPTTEGDHILRDLAMFAEQLRAMSRRVERIHVRAFAELEHVAPQTRIDLSTLQSRALATVIETAYVPTNRAWIEFSDGSFAFVKIREGEP